MPSARFLKCLPPPLGLLSTPPQIYTTICFMGHNVTVVEADARPIAPATFRECVDVNSGQRLDVEVKADAKPGAYWIAVRVRGRPGL
jgi:FtsP/CotA-like multicopper oxidase with cupredoxin domain